MGDDYLIRGATRQDLAVAIDDFDDEVFGSDVHPVLRAPVGETQAAELAWLASLSGGLKERMDQLEAQVLKEAMIRHRWNKSRAARELGLSRVGLRSKLVRYGLEQ